MKLAHDNASDKSAGNHAAKKCVHAFESDFADVDVAAEADVGSRNHALFRSQAQRRHQGPTANKALGTFKVKNNE